MMRKLKSVLQQVANGGQKKVSVAFHKEIRIDGRDTKLAAFDLCFELCRELDSGD